MIQNEQQKCSKSIILEHSVKIYLMNLQNKHLSSAQVLEQNFSNSLRDSILSKFFQFVFLELLKFNFINKFH